jgi:hypothetical protein
VIARAASLYPPAINTALKQRKTLSIESPPDARRTAVLLTVAIAR